MRLFYHPSGELLHWGRRAGFYLPERYLYMPAPHGCRLPNVRKVALSRGS